ncbi:restriction endonuclease subunit S [Alloalcanivorax profundimaris]|uniref:restriction endonuclease subunit S n=1 Tax=Alloalcanivorax profundimaris TaxID=2735259 RepID=UPI001886C09A|nr:restriction endonuclease subunit S [Alloalcanivorax profundimaris]MBF1802192.1 restriction endonuclease subunit S [Alloalcanivorax profundimaris]MCQ6261047.1 restriction endonuclease subunit S [Alcanivorax sp. MM125-6]
MSAETLITDNLDLWTGAITKRITSGRGSNKKIELTGIHKLRHLILELACHGKIVPQLVSETPACEVLEDLQLRRKELIRKKKIKNSKPLPNVSADEKPSKLPSNWVWTRLGSIAEINPRNSAEDATKASFVPMPLITTSYHGYHGHETKPWGKIKKGYTHFADGDVALAKITPCFENSKAAVFRGLINGLGAGTTELHVARPLSNAVNPYYLILFLKSPRFLIAGEKVMTGSAGQKRVPKDYFSSTPLPLPPTEEQHRIVQKVDELMALCDRLEQQTSDQIDAHDTLVDTLLGTLTQSQNATELAENWTRLAAHCDTLFTTEQSIDKLKQTILQLAVMGLLVEQNDQGEKASSLISRILDTRDRLAKEKNMKTKARETIDPDDTYLSIPENWTWIRLGNTAKFIDYRGKTPRKINRGKRLITAKNIRQGYIDLTPEEFISEQDYTDWMTRGFPRTNDLLFTPEAPLGNAAIVNLDEEFALAQRTICFQWHTPEIAQFMLIQIMASPFQEQLVKNATGMTATGIKASKLKEIPVAIPPLQEQERIVQKVDELMTLCNRLQKSLNQVSKTRCQLAETIVGSALQ